MPTAAYARRIARSKARLAEELEELAGVNAELTVPEFVALARTALHCPITETYAGELLRDAQARAAAAPRR